MMPLAGALNVREFTGREVIRNGAWNELKRYFIVSEILQMIENKYL
jgi:hypothetical protein